MRDAFGATFDVPSGYLNTASIGIPPSQAAEATLDAVRRWQSGLSDPPDFSPAVETSRRMFAGFVGVPEQRVAIGASVSQLVGLIAASVPDGTRVLVASGEFTSVSFPFAAQADRGVTVAEAELTEIPERAGEYDVVAVSAVQSADGRMVDLDALAAATRDRSTRVLIDVTQAAGWLPLSLEWADWVVAAGYKWLLAPRGAAWLAVRPDAEVRPQVANWWAGADPWVSSTYGLPMRLAEGARALDLSPVWFSHVGAEASMRWLAGVDMAEVRRHCTGLADDFLAELGLPPAGSAIVSIDVPDAADRLRAAGVRFAARAGRVRLAFHLYNTREDVDQALAALRAV